MIVATEKRKTNIAEYLLYMWQVEDLIRAMNVDMARIRTTIVESYQVDADKKKEIETWYENLVIMMQKEQKQQQGHLQFLVNLSNDLNRFHRAILQNNIDAEYTRLYDQLKPDIDLVREKSKLQHHDVDVILNALYILLMLKMKKQEISEGTQNAVYKFGNFMGHLSKLYKAYEHGDLELDF